MISSFLTFYLKNSELSSVKFVKNNDECNIKKFIECKTLIGKY